MKIFYSKSFGIYLSVIIIIIIIYLLSVTCLIIVLNSVSLFSDNCYYDSSYDHYDCYPHCSYFLSLSSVQSLLFIGFLLLLFIITVF